MLLNLLMVMDLVLGCTASFLCVFVLSLGDSSEYSECYPPNDVESLEYFTLNQNQKFENLINFVN